MNVDLAEHAKADLKNVCKTRLLLLKQSQKTRKVWTADQEERLSKWVAEKGETDLAQLSLLLGDKSVKRIKDKLLALQSQPKRK